MQDARGDSIALVSDAGTPLVERSGFDLVMRARDTFVVAIPARARRLRRCRSPVCTDRCVSRLFAAKTAARSERLEQLAREERTLIFYEAPHRLAEVLRDMTRIFGAERNASISRELTKRFETTYSGTLAQLSEADARDSDMSRGELVIVVSGAPATSTARELDSDALLRALLQELSPSQAAKVAAHVTGGKRSELYEAALRLGKCLASPADRPHHHGRSRPGNRCAQAWRKVRAPRARRQVTPGGREPTESATESKPPKCRKRCWQG